MTSRAGVLPSSLLVRRRMRRCQWEPCPRSPVRCQSESLSRSKRLGQHRLPLVQCMSPLLAQSGHGEMSSYLSAFGGKADISRRLATITIYEYTPFCNGPGDVKSPRVIVTPPSSRFCPWLALRPPHYAVRRNGEPI